MYIQFYLKTKFKIYKPCISNRTWYIKIFHLPVSIRNDFSKYQYLHYFPPKIVVIFLMNNFTSIKSGNSENSETADSKSESEERASS